MAAAGTVSDSTPGTPNKMKMQEERHHDHTRLRASIAVTTKNENTLAALKYDNEVNRWNDLFRATCHRFRGKTIGRRQMSPDVLILSAYFHHPVPVLPLPQRKQAVRRPSAAVRRVERRNQGEVPKTKPMLVQGRKRAAAIQHAPAIL